MAEASFEHIRPELYQTIIFNELPLLDTNPIPAVNARLIPGPAYSEYELKLLSKLAQQRPDGLILPTIKQLARITRNALTGCWEIEPGQSIPYGRMSITGTYESLAHRGMFKVFYGHGSIKRGERVDHLCKNEPCCYPRHLQSITHANNVRIGNSSKRSASETQQVFDYR